MDGALGAIRVARVKRVDDADSRGEWDMETRVVKIARSRNRVNEWATLFHELTHAAIADAEIPGLTDAMEEAICEAMARARVREMAKQLGL
ncbi:MAG: hypothetical protein ACYC3F_17000 [Gemmatimonadaceae bacterium]